MVAFSVVGTSSNGLVFVIDLEVADGWFSGVVISLNEIALAVGANADAALGVLNSVGVTSKGLVLKLIICGVTGFASAAVVVAVLFGIAARRPFSNKSSNNDMSFMPMNFCFSIGEKTLFTSSALSRF